MKVSLMTRLFYAVAVAVVLAACGSTTVVTTTTTTPPKLGAPTGEATQPDSNPVKQHYNDHDAGPVTTPTYKAASGCGVERWAVKTGTDPGANAVNLTPQDTTVAALDSIAPPVNPSDRVAPTETTTFHIQATVTAVKQEADSDYHLALSDGQGNTMIAESPSPSCDSGSRFATQIAQVRSVIDQACPGIGGTYQNVSIPADLTGVGFYDRLHGQRGVAPNGIELHPLTAIALHGHC